MIDDRPLDIDTVQTFIRLAELGSFTRTADAMFSTQASVSQKIKRLETRLGRRLFERTPRHVHLTNHGEVFLVSARALMDAHARALAQFSEAVPRLSIGISEHVVGSEFAPLLTALKACEPGVVFDIRIASSADLLQSLDRREFDAVLVRLDFGRADGVVIAAEQYGWFASPEWTPDPAEPLPLITLAEPCGVRALAATILDEADIRWREAMVGGGIATVAAAVMAGFGVAALAPRMLPAQAVDVGPQLALPVLPELPVVLHARGKGRRLDRWVNALGQIFGPRG